MFICTFASQFVFFFIASVCFYRLTLSMILVAIVCVFTGVIVFCVYFSAPGYMCSYTPLPLCCIYSNCFPPYSNVLYVPFSAYSLDVQCLIVLSFTCVSAF